MQNNFYIYDTKIALSKSKKIFKKKFEISEISKSVTIVIVINNILIKTIKKISNSISKTIFKNFIISKIIMLLFKKEKRFLKKNSKLIINELK